MEALIDAGHADMISMCRTLIREPDLVAKLESGEVDGASCVSCNKCFDPRGVRCNYDGGWAGLGWKVYKLQSHIRI